MHTSDAEGGRASSRKKQPDATVAVVVVKGEDENAVKLAGGDVHACTQTRVAAKERALSRGASGRASGPIVHARGWVGSLLKCKP